MSAESDLLRAYREWRRLALAESKAIQTRNWSLLADCHQAIRDYQSIVSSLTRAARAEWQSAGCNLPEKERNLRVVVADLLEITRQNQDRMQATRAHARRRLDELGDAGQKLRLIRRAYGQAPCGRFN
jgi:DNA anti-recombination protein RmuC